MHKFTKKETETYYAELVVEPGDKRRNLCEFLANCIEEDYL